MAFLEEKNLQVYTADKLRKHSGSVILWETICWYGLCPLVPIEGKVTGNQYCKAIRHEGSLKWFNEYELWCKSYAMAFAVSRSQPKLTPHYHHHLLVSWVRIFYKNGVHPSCRVPEICGTYAKHWSCSVVAHHLTNKFFCFSCHLSVNLHASNNLI